MLTPLNTHAADLKIAAAANLQQVMTHALIPLFQKQTGATVTPTFGSTKLLATQLQNGAPIDVFVSADTVTIDQLAAQGLVVPSSRRVYAIGRLVMWTARTAAHHPRRLQDLADPAYAKIAIADPRLAPYGLAAQQSFAKLGLTALVMPRLLVARNIGEALQYARSGNADVSLTALSLVIADKDDPYVIVPDNLHTPIAQSLAIVNATTEPALAAQFAAFLTGKAAAPIWKRYGYELPRRPLTPAAGPLTPAASRRPSPSEGRGLGLTQDTPLLTLSPAPSGSASAGNERVWERVASLNEPGEGVAR